MDDLKINIRNINDLIASEIKKIASSNILHYRSLDLSKYNSKSVRVDSSNINYNVLDAYKINYVKHIVVTFVTHILSDIFHNLLSSDNLPYTKPSDISKSSIVSRGNSIYIPDKMTDFFNFNIYTENNRTIIVNPYLNFNEEQLILFDNMSLDIKLNAYTIDNTENMLSLEFLYYIDFKNLENKKIYINE